MAPLNPEEEVRVQDMSEPSPVQVAQDPAAVPASGSYDDEYGEDEEYYDDQDEDNQQFQAPQPFTVAPN